MNVYIIGLGRCGSTRLYNLVIKMCEYVYDKTNVNCGMNITPSPNFTCNIIKCHDSSGIRPQPNDVVLFPVRNMKDCFVSFRGHHAFTNDIKQFCSLQSSLLKSCDHLKRVRHVIKYEDYGIEQVVRVAKLLNIELEVDILIGIMDIIENIHLTNPPYDRYLIRHDHCGKRFNKQYEQCLTAHEQEYIDKFFDDYQREYQYSRE